MSARIALAQNISKVASTALMGMMPDIRNIRVEGKVEWQGGCGVVKPFVSGVLPSGRSYEIPLGLDLEKAFGDAKGAWVNSIDLARELRKVAQAFKVAVALGGKSDHINSPSLEGVNRLADKVTFAAIMPSGTDRLHIEVQSVDGLEWHVAQNTGFGRWEVLLHPKHQRIVSLKAYGDSKCWTSRVNYRI